MVQNSNGMGQLLEARGDTLGIVVSDGMHGYAQSRGRCQKQTGGGKHHRVKLKVLQ